MLPRLLEGVAARWVPGTGAVRVAPLGTGLVNANARVERDGRSYALRIAATEAEHLGLDRCWECRVLATAAASGLAPPLCVCAPADGVLVMEWAAGRIWTPAEVTAPEGVATMARLLRQVHVLQAPPPVRQRSPAAWIAEYGAQLGAAPSGTEPRCQALRAHAQRRLAALEASIVAPPVLCHGDLHRFNVVVQTRPILIDWEFAHVTDPYWDLAGWIANNDESPSFAAALLDHYLERRACPDETRHLTLMCWLYDYVCLLWSDLYMRWRPAGAQGSVAERAERLRTRLWKGAGGRAGEVPAH